MANLIAKTTQSVPAPSQPRTAADMQTAEQHSLPLSIALHLAPGVVLVLFYALLVPPLLRVGLNNFLTLNLLAVLILVPVELGILYAAGKSATGRWSLRSVVLNREHVPLWQFIGLAFGLLVWMALISMLVAHAIDPVVQKALFGWLPAWFPLNTNFNAMPRAERILTLAAALVCTSWVALVVEEFYFRGYLLPRLSRFGNWAPVINAVLFAVYHLFTPWQAVTRILMVLPLAWIARRKRNLYIGLAAHLLLNSLGILPALIVAVLK